MAPRCVKLNFCKENSTNLLIGWNGTTTKDGHYMPRVVQPNGSDFGRTYLFNTSSNWLMTSNVFLWQGLLGLLRLQEDRAEIEMGLLWVLTWLTSRRGLCRQFPTICPGPPQYRHRLFAQRRYFSTCDNGPRRRVISNSIGVGNSIKHGFDTCGGLATTEAYVSVGQKRNICWCSERRSNKRLSHCTARLIASVRDFGSSWEVRSKSFTSLRRPWQNWSINASSSHGISHAKRRKSTA